MTETLELLRAAAPAALDGEPVAVAYLYGSYATGTAGPRSDVDIAVKLVVGAEVDPLELRLRLADRFERLAGIGPVEVVVLDESPIALAGRVQEQRTVIHSNDEQLRVRYESETSRHFHDFKIHEERSAEERLARLAEGG